MTEWKRQEGRARTTLVQLAALGGYLYEEADVVAVGDELGEEASVPLPNDERSALPQAGPVHL